MTSSKTRTLRSGAVLLSALTASFGFAPSVTGTHVATPAAHAEAGPTISPDLVL